MPSLYVLENLSKKLVRGKSLVLKFRLKHGEQIQELKAPFQELMKKLETSMVSLSLSYYDAGNRFSEPVIQFVEKRFQEIERMQNFATQHEQ
jgi:hypothetical protein